MKATPLRLKARESFEQAEQRAGLPVPNGAGLAKKGRFMNATSLSFGLLIVLFTILLAHWMRKLKPQIAGFQSQRKCPSCGLITSRLKASCLVCGKPFTAVVYSTSKPQVRDPLLGAETQIKA